ncbi:MAG: hypothetical protein Q8922_15020 [Bacteroidota bacterium]|nr:hypothetical protein [Bacteroidota bacterium]
MLDESTGLGERRARTVVIMILFAQAVWAFLFKYLPLDAGLWALQSELVRTHLSGSSHDALRVIPFPVANMGAPFLGALMTSIMSGEIATRILLTFGGIFLRGLGIVMLFRVLHVRDIAVYLLVPILVMSGVWFSGALPLLLAETAAFWVLAFFLSQEHPHSVAFWIISLGLLLVAWFHALVFLLLVVVILMVMREQSRSVHLSQGWLSEPRAVMSLLLPGVVLVVLGFIGGEPILQLSSSHLLPDGLRRSLFLLTPAPDVIEATFRYENIVHLLLTVLFGIVVLGCFARAYLLAIEEVTWQSRALRTAGYVLLVLALLGPLFASSGIETSSGLILATVLVLAGSYSGGPAVRRTPADRLLYTGALIAIIASLGLNAFSIAVGSSAASDVLKSSRMLIAQERQQALEDEHLDNIRIRFVLDSALVATQESGLVGRLSYSSTAPMYLFGEHDLLAQPSAFQPRGGMVRTNTAAANASPVFPMQLGSEDRYVDSTMRILAAMNDSSHISPSFGPFSLYLTEDAGMMIDKGEANYRLMIGKLKAGHPIEMAVAR